MTGDGGLEGGVRRRLEGGFDDVSAVLAERIGLRSDPTFRSRVARAVDLAAADRGIDPGELARRVRHDPAVLQALVDRITVQETSFFRDPGQFDALRDVVAPAVEADGLPRRIWSAGCANGQESYSLAITLAEGGHDDWEVLATDISTHSVTRTRAGRYEAHELRGLDAHRRQRWLRPEPAGRGGEIGPELRAKVRVSAHNLMAVPPFPPGHCSVVFCRNVLIYFDAATIAALVERFATWLPPGGWLFLGYSETLHDVPSPFTLTRLGASFAYRAPGGRAERTEPGWPPSTVPIAPPSTVASAATGASPPPLDAAATVAAFRRAVYLDPDDPSTHLDLGIALKKAGDHGEARRSFAAARAAIDRLDPKITARTDGRFGGRSLADMVRALDEHSDETGR